MLKTDFSPWPSFTEEEAKAVRDVLLSNRVNYWTGEEARVFESEFADWVNAKYAIALMNGKMSYATIVYLDEGFNLIQSVPGYQTPENLEPILHFLVTDEYKTTPWEEFQKTFKSNL